jgi:hypothetical protein
MLQTTKERTTRGEAVRAVGYGLILLWLNLYIARDMFYGSTAFMASMHGFWTAIAARAGSTWFHATWWPFWDFGIPFEWTYPPLVPGLAAAIAAVRGISPAIGFHSVTGLFYILSPLTLFLMCWRLMRAPGYAFLAALFYSLTSVSQIIVPDGNFALANLLDSRRLFVMAVWDDTPHVAALTFLPLVILFLARAIETRRIGYCAGAAACIGGATLASAFGPVMVVTAAVCLLLVLRREQWRGNLVLVAGIGFWGWAIAAPFLSPSLMRAIREANAGGREEGWSLGSWTALAVVILGGSVLLHWMRNADWRLRFFALFAWVTSAIPLLQVFAHRHFLPQPGRYKFEMELALAAAIVFGLRTWLERMPRSVRGALLLVVLAMAGDQAAFFRKQEKKFTFPQPLTGTVEYRAATWAQKNYPALRIFLPGSIAQWADAFTDTQQFTGESFSMATNQVQQRADAAIAFGVDDVHRDAELSLTWLKAYGTGLVAISGKNSEEYWKPFTHPEKFDGVLPVLWSQGGVNIYRVPLREFTLAHIVPENALVTRAPKAPEDVRQVERYVVALDDPALPSTAFTWEGRNRIRIRTTAADGQAVSVQVTHHPGWHATVGGRPRELHRDGLGLMWLRPGVLGPCEIVLDYDGGWELRLCRWLSWAAFAGLVFVPLRLRTLP